MNYYLVFGVKPVAMLPFAQKITVNSVQTVELATRQPEFAIVTKIGSAQFVPVILTIPVKMDFL